jgi:hypothetical protein
MTKTFTRSQKDNPKPKTHYKSLLAHLPTFPNPSISQAQKKNSGTSGRKEESVAKTLLEFPFDK